MRLLAGLLAAQDFDSTLIGDASLTNRPMQRVVKPLTAMGANIYASEDGKPPLVIHGKQHLSAMRYIMPVASAQVKSCLLLAGLYAQGKTSIVEPAICRDHTERMLRAFGVNINCQGNEILLIGGQQLQATAISVPADMSSAAFFLVGATIGAGSSLLIKNVGLNPTRIGVINILRMMGASINIQHERLSGEEPVGDLLVTARQLHGIAIPVDQVPLAIDEFPAIFIAAACAKGETTLSGAKELRVKESDRIAAMAQGLTALGIKTTVYRDGIRITGGQLKGGQVNSFGDHRIAMAFAMASLVAKEPIQILNCDNVATSFPNFTKLAAKVGLNIEEVVEQ